MTTANVKNDASFTTVANDTITTYNCAVIYCLRSATHRRRDAPTRRIISTEYTETLHTCVKIGTLYSYDHVNTPVNCLQSYLLWSPIAIGQTIIFLPCDFYLLSFSIPRLISAAADWMSTILLHMAWPYSAKLECRSEICCSRHAANTGRKNSPKISIWAPSHNFVGLYLRN